VVVETAIERNKAGVRDKMEYATRSAHGIDVKSKALWVVITAWLLTACQAESIPSVAAPTLPDTRSLEVAIPNEGRDQVSTGAAITYRHYPPASGPYYPEVIQYGLYEMDVPEGYWVHILERGGIVFLYKCAGNCSTLKKQIGDLLDTVPLSKHNTAKLAIVPYQNMPHFITAVAWDVQMPLDQFDARLLTAFYAAHVDKGPEDAP
jgi:hypothetical protein